MKKIFKILFITVGVIISLVLLCLATGNSHIVKGVWACYLHGAVSPTIDDARFFDTHTVHAGSNAWDWPQSKSYNKQSVSSELMTHFKETGTVAFLVIQNDSIISENYWDGYSDSSRSNSFSMAKSITTMMAEIAMQKGLFQGWHQKVNTILPYLKGPHADELELWHLSTMSSGLDWNENYTSPWTITAVTYYGPDVRDEMKDLPIKDVPGKKFIYQSGSTALLSFCLMKVTGKPLSDIASEWLWKPLQAKHDALWHTDSKGTEMAWCCFNSNARDFAHFGKLMLHHGNWNGTQILDSSFTSMATSPALDNGYGYSFWLDDTQGTKAFFQWGLDGQYIITIPGYNAVVVRLGDHDIINEHARSVYCGLLIKEALSILKSTKAAS
jgi:CubicO group peptidase (beta-lactamase class C family)